MLYCLSAGNRAPHGSQKGAPVASSIAYDDRQSPVGDSGSFACVLPGPAEIHPLWSMVNCHVVEARVKSLDREF